ncbi:MAG: hypothetical protein BWX73_02177 [Lentisphaerae bacterium ADurb.Bin082]|jgi:hypothetical protein|uniref:hypothetical protein n=1 Tax=Candidatus Skiveiella danica TaxID=3386177 RepID=UPI0009C46369|nr:hypothetical protein [Comamonadaceae bacterium]MBK6559728.1 hypothetical protein [Comamonadaceae bacterium]MBK9198034.1 hypothetical protein [Betaproteobacteria bacterium]MBK9986701.1 hypothetical protein [Betaproteobacteria bacterium]OQC13735.1 MAG: hypothetical protein BWX73_02177 [Lentisphaerae bacterium ADurb.Bin082]
MHILRHAHEVSAFIQTYTDQAVATLIQQCLSDLLHGDDLTMEELVFFVVPDPGETIQQLVEALGTDLQTVDGSPLWEFIEEHPSCYEFVLVLSQDGFGAEVFISKTGIDADLLALCQLHAVPVKAGIDT